MTKPTIFIHTNANQYLGALVSAHSLKRNSKRPEFFDVKILRLEDFPFFQAFEGKTFLRGSEHRVWHNADLQSFTPLRFLAPEKMGYEGRAVVIDPDVFAVGDIVELLERDLEGRAIGCVLRPGHNNKEHYLATSVMLLDSAKLTHWRCEADFAELFEFRRDYIAWMCLEMEQRDSIALLEPVWNHFDRLDETTKLLHNTKRRTQPWKTGLPIDFTVRDKSWGPISRRWIMGVYYRLKGEGSRGRYQRHPDPKQERFFFDLLRECLETGSVSEDLIRAEMVKDHLRHDAFGLLKESRARPA